MKRLFLLLLCLGLPVCAVFAQRPQFIRGFVTHIDGSPAENIEIRLREPSSNSFTDSRGEFRIQLSPFFSAGEEVTIFVDLEGYEVIRPWNGRITIPQDPNRQWFEIMIAERELAAAIQNPSQLEDLIERQRTQSEEEGLLSRLRVWLSKHPIITLILITYIALLLLWLILLLVRPLWLLKINDSLKPYADWQLPSWLGGLRIPTRYLLLVGIFHYHPRVLDAWVAHHLQIAKDVFYNKDTVAEREVHIDLPVLFNDALTERLSSSQLQAIFSQNIASVLIWGEGGIGKTSIACKLGRWAMASSASKRLCTQHPMLPVLLETNFDNFLSAVKAEVRFLIDSPTEIPEDLLLKLLRKKRLLVIIDHLSEMSTKTLQAMRPDDKAFPANAIIITSRLREQWGGRRMATLEPLRIEGDYVSEFMSAYLRNRGKRKLFPDHEYFSSLGRLSTMVGTRDITVLLAKLYAEQMIAVKEGTTTEMPDNIPDLMLSYLNELNREAEELDPDNRRLHRVSKLLAWTCVKKTYRPGVADLDEVQELLRLKQEDDAIITYFEKKLRLIKKVGPAEDGIRFTMDPLAEYLAGLYVVEEAGKDETTWRRFLDDAVVKTDTPDAIKDFLLAVHDCCLHRNYREHVPEFVRPELLKQAGPEQDAQGSSTSMKAVSV